MAHLADSATNQLTLTQLEVLQHLVGGLNVTTAARKLHIHRATIYRWLKESPAFRDTLAQYHRVIAESAPERVRELRIQALDTLEDCLSGSLASPAVRLRAAMYLLNQTARHGVSALLLPPPQNTPSATECDTFENSPPPPPNRGKRARRPANPPPSPGGM